MRLGTKALLGTYYAVQNSPAEPAVEIASFMYSWGLRSNTDGGCGRESQGECPSYNAILCAIPRVTKDMVRGLIILSEHDNAHRGKGNLFRKRVWCSYCSRLCYTEVLTRSSSTTDEAFLSAVHTYYIDAGSKRMITSLLRITMPIEETYVICSRTMPVRIPRQLSKRKQSCEVTLMTTSVHVQTLHRKGQRHCRGHSRTAVLQPGGKCIRCQRRGQKKYKLALTITGTGAEMRYYPVLCTAYVRQLE
jgi:hypothetical protein